MSMDRAKKSAVLVDKVRKLWRGIKHAIQAARKPGPAAKKPEAPGRRQKALAAKKQPGSPEAFDHGPEAAAARIPRTARPGQKPEGPRSHFHSFHNGSKKSRPDRTEQRPNAQKDDREPKKAANF